MDSCKDSVYCDLATNNKHLFPLLDKRSRSFDNLTSCFVQGLFHSSKLTGGTHKSHKGPFKVPLRVFVLVPQRRIANSIRCCSREHSSENNAKPSNFRRQAQVQRKTSETQVFANIVLDGKGKADIDTGIPFLDHMLCQISSHGLFDLHIKATGDLHIDDHHTNEDVGITLGLALLKAVGDKRGIQRFGHFIAPLDEALVQVVLDLSGRPYLHYGLDIPTQRVGTFDTQLVREFYSAVANNGQFTLHIRQLQGINSHHIIEASFKAFARALRMAIEYDTRRMDSIPSSKGSLSEDTQVINK